MDQPPITSSTEQPPQPIQPAAQPQQIPPHHNPQWLKPVSIGLSVLSLGIAIAVSGYILTTNKNKPTQSSTIITSPTPSPTPTDPTADWKTYTNNKFSFKYPSSWKIKSSDQNSVTFSKSIVGTGPTGKPQTFSSEFNVFSSPVSNTSLNEWFRIRYPVLEGQDLQKMLNSWSKKSTLNGIEALYVNCGGCHPSIFNEGYLIIYKDYGYDIRADGVFRAMSKNDLDELISTFKFTQ